MKEKILAALKTKFTGINEQILSRVADKLAAKTAKEEDIDAAVGAITFQQIIDSEADRRATDATQTAVSNYEKKHGLKDGQKVKEDDPSNSKKTTTQEQEEGGNLEAITKALAAAIEPLKNEIAQLKSGRLQETRKQRLDEVIKDLPDNFKKPYNRISIAEMSEEDFNSLIEEATEGVKQVIKDTKTQGSVFTTPKTNVLGVSENKASDEEVDAVIKNIT